MNTKQNFSMPGYGIETSVDIAQIIGDKDGTRIRFSNGYVLKRTIDNCFDISQFGTHRKVSLSFNTTNGDNIDRYLHRFQTGWLRISEDSVEWKDENILFIFTFDGFTLDVKIYSPPHCEEEEPVE